MTETRPDRAARALTTISVVAALVLTAQAEWTLALAAGWHAHVAWAWPAALDAFVLAAFRAGRDRSWALSLMAVSVSAAHAVPIAYPAGLPWWLAGAVSVIPPLVAWRIHELGRGRAVARPARARRTAPAERPVPAPTRPAAVDAAAPASAAPVPLHAVGASDQGADDELLGAARAAARTMADAGKSLTRDGLREQLREDGHAVGAARAGNLLRALRAEQEAA
jgi:hypothetical protein